jgi:5-methylcytosine-specific restriction protein A
MSTSPDWDNVGRADVDKAVEEYDRLGPEAFFARHGFAPTTTYEMVVHGRTYPPKAILGVAYEIATGSRLASADFEGGRSGAVKVLSALGFTVRQKHRPRG